MKKFSGIFIKTRLEEGCRLEAVCRTDVDPSTWHLDIKHNTGHQLPLGLSFSNVYLSLNAVTRQENGLQLICSSGTTSDILTLNVLPASNASAFQTISHLLALHFFDLYY